MTPGELLVGTPEQFALANRRDMELARGRVARLKAMPSPRGLAEALGAYDDAVGALADASSRASVRLYLLLLCHQEVDAPLHFCRTRRPAQGEGKGLFDLGPGILTGFALQELQRVVRQQIDDESFNLLDLAVDFQFRIAR